MKRVFGVVLSALAAVVLVVPVSPVAQAAVGQVVVFTIEADQLAVYENPRGCRELPIGAHVLSNVTDRKLAIHADPACMTPSLLVVEPGYGTHVPPAGASFRI